MSGGVPCRCNERKEPIGDSGKNRPGRLWRVMQRMCNHSAFNGYHYTPSKYSSVSCLRCGGVWRTTASYVSQLRDMADDERFTSAGYAGHVAAMEARGRSPYRGGES